MLAALFYILVGVHNKIEPSYTFHQHAAVACTLIGKAPYFRLLEGTGREFSKQRSDNISYHGALK